MTTGWPGEKGGCKVQEEVVTEGKQVEEVHQQKQEHVKYGIALGQGQPVLAVQLKQMQA